MELETAFATWRLKIFSLILLKTEIVGAGKNKRDEAVLMSTHNICFWAKIRKIIYNPL